ncbi:MAG: rcsC [Bacteroidetes bacterium]|nr:rcsC [Bacteroidota bacterium]
MRTKPQSTHYFLQGGGEMGALMRHTDWIKTGLGEPEEWPQSLQTAVSMMLENKVGMYIAWGQDFIQLYNDAYRPILGSTKHPQALGISSRETFIEIWHIIGPMFEDVMKGKAVGFPDFMLPLNREGFVEKCYFDFSYSPLRKEDGEVGGVLVTVIETTQRRKTEDELKKSEERFRTMADNIPNLAWMADSEGWIFWYNKKWYEYTGTTPQQMEGWGWQSVHDPAALPFVMERWKASLQTGNPFEMVFPMKGADGKFRQFLTRVLPVKDAEGNIYQWFGTNTDISLQNETEALLKESEEKIRSIVQSAPFPIGVYKGEDLIIELANPSIIETWGKGNDVIGRSYKEILPELDNQEIFKQLSDVIKTGIAFHAKNRRVDLVVNNKLQSYYFNYSFTPLFDASGKVYGVINTGADVTDLNLAKIKLEEAQDKAQLAIDSAQLGVYEIIYATDEMFTDRRFKEIWGVGPTVKRHEYAAVIHPDDLPVRRKAHDDSLKTGNLYYQARVIWKDHSVHWVRVTGKISYNDNKQPEKLLGVIQDVTSYVLAQKQAEESERNLRQTILQAPVAMCILRGPDHVVELANDRMYELWGKPAAELSNKPIFVGLPEAKDQGFEKLLHDVYTTAVPFFANEVPINLPRAGEIKQIYINFLYEPYHETDGTVSGVIAVAVDVTEQTNATKKIEQMVAERTSQLATANQKLQKSNEELAQFAYIASHDLQEPLRKISTFTQMLENSIGDKIDEHTKNYVHKIITASNRMNTLIRDVLTYSQLVKENELFEPVNLNTVIESIITDYDLLIEQKKATIEFNGLPVIEAVPMQMAQLFGNLVGNALKFTRADVNPLIRITAEKVSEEEIKSLGLAAGLDYYGIKVSDNGIGFKPEHAEQIFNIFQRLHRKSEFEGTGIGLAMCKKIALNHKGNINANGSSANGAVFTVFLPLKQ